MRKRVLLTGAFGNVGQSAVRELLRQGHVVRCFDLKTKANQKAADKLAGQIEVQWGDIRNLDDVQVAVMDQDVVIHLVAIIPPLSEICPDWSHAIKVGGTRNVITAIQSLAQPPKLIYASSVALFGRDQDRPPPCTVADPIQPTDHYTSHKAECEQMVQAFGLQWAIFRLGAVVPIAFAGKDPRLIFKEMFEVPLNQRIECVHTADVGLALANAVNRPDIWGKILLIGGGPKFQLHQRDFFRGTLDAMGIGMFLEEAFGSEPHHTHWMDTTESQRLLNYQRIFFEDYLRELCASLGYKRYLILLFRPLIRYWILRQSPYYAANRKKAKA